MTTLNLASNFEYRSKEEINGSPIVHINIGTDPETGRPLVAKGVVAIGTVAIGVVSIGAAAFGVIALGGFGLGVVSLAGLAIGTLAFGAVALGYEFALGAAVLSAEYSIGVIDLDPQFVLWSSIVTVSLALVIWGLAKAKAARQQS